MIALPARQSSLDTMTAWTIDPERSRVDLLVKRFAVTRARASLEGVTGVIRAVGDDSWVHVDVRIPAATLTTGQKWQDRHLRSEAFLDTASYPVISFLGRRIRGDRRGTFSLDGDLSIRGTTRDTIVQVSAHERADDRATFHVKTTIDRRDFGLLPATGFRMGGLFFGYEVRIEALLVLERAASLDAELRRGPTMYPTSYVPTLQGRRRRVAVAG
jgi:polyisoprenoid-binding protein YceI